MTQSEDCLTINITVPKSAIKNKQKVPIVYFIHGGNNQQGVGFISTWSVRAAQNHLFVRYTLMCDFVPVLLRIPLIPDKAVMLEETLMAWSIMVSCLFLSTTDWVD